MKKIIITGSNGLLGQSLLELLLKNNEKYIIFGISKGENRSGRTDFSYFSLDITDEKLLKKTIESIQPDAIIHTAAMTQVDACETEKKACDILNIEVVRWLKEISESLKIHLIHISTDFIFDGKKGFYKETDAPNPLSYYGVSKLKSEQILTESSIDYTILRTILVYGKVYDMSRNNIVLWVRKTISEGKKITIVNDQFRMPTYVKELALACKIAIDKRAIGIFNVSSNQLLSIFEIAQQIAEVFELDKSLIIPISSQTLNQKAKRPEKTGFDVSKTTKKLGLETRPFKEDLLEFKKSLNF